MAGEVQSTRSHNLIKIFLCFPVPSQPNKTNCNLRTPPIGGDTTLTTGYKWNPCPEMTQIELFAYVPCSSHFF